MADVKDTRNATLPALPDANNDFGELMESGLKDVGSKFYKAKKDDQKGVAIDPETATVSVGAADSYASQIDRGLIITAANNSEVHELLRGTGRFYKDGGWYQIKKTPDARGGESELPEFGTDGRPKTDQFGRMSYPIDKDSKFNGVEGLPWETFKFESAENKIRFGLYGTNLPEALTETSCGKAAFDALKGFLQGSEKVEGKQVDGQGLHLMTAFGRHMSGYGAALKDVSAQTPAEGAGYNIDLSQYLVALKATDASGKDINGIHENTSEDKKIFGPALAMIIRHGWLEKATGVDFANATVTFATKEDAIDALKKIFLVQEELANDIADTANASLSWYIYGTESEEKKDDAYLTSAWAWGAYRALGGGGGTVETKDLQESLSVLATDKLKSLKSNTEFKAWSPEEEKHAIQDYRFFKMVKVGNGVELREIHNGLIMNPNTNPPTLIGVWPLGFDSTSYESTADKDYSKIKDIKLETGESIPDQDQLKTYFSGQESFHTVQTADGKNLIFFLHPDYVFAGKSAEGSVPVIRIPTVFADRPNNQVASSGAVEMRNLAVSENDKTARFYVTLSEYQAMSNNGLDYVGGGGSLLYANRDSNALPTWIINPFTNKSEPAVAIRWGVPSDSSMKVAEYLNNQLLQSGYPKEYLTKEKYKDLWYPGHYEKGWLLDSQSITSKDLDPNTWQSIAPEEIDKIFFKKWFNNEERDDQSVDFYGIKMSRKRAAFLVAVIVAYNKDASSMGISPGEAQALAMKLQMDQQEAYMSESKEAGYYSTGMFLAGSALMQWWAVKRQEKVQKELMQLGAQQKDAEEIAKRMRDPDYCPDFMRKLDVPSNKYFTTPMTEAQIRGIMKSLVGDSGYSAAFMVGPAGVGKTEMMREIQRRILLPRQEAVKWGVPEELLGKSVYEVVPDAFMANTQWMGATESKMAMMKLFAKNKGCIVFMDEAKMLVSAGKHSGGPGEKAQGNNPFELLLRDLSDRTIRMVFATTKQEFEQDMLTRVDLEAFFRRVEQYDLKPYDVDTVKIALSEIYAGLLEKYQLLRFDDSQYVEINGKDSLTGADVVYKVPKAISDIVDGVASAKADAASPYRLVDEKPNLILDYSIKKLKAIAVQAMNDLLAGDNLANFERQIDGDLLRLRKEVLDLQQRIRMITDELKPLEDKLITTPGHKFNQKLRLFLRYQILKLEKQRDVLKTKLGQVEEKMRLSAGDPRLIPIYEYRIQSAQSVMQANVEMLATANLSDGQRNAARSRYESLFGDNGRYSEIWLEINRLQQQIIDGRPTLQGIYNRNSKLFTGLVDTAPDQIMAALQKSMSFDDFAEVSRQDNLMQELFGLQEQNKTVLSEYTLLRYQMGEDVLSKGEVAELKKSIEGTTKQIRKFEKILGQLQQSAAEQTARRPQGAVIGEHFVEQYFRGDKTYQRGQVMPDEVKRARGLATEGVGDAQTPTRQAPEPSPAAPPTTTTTTPTPRPSAPPSPTPPAASADPIAARHQDLESKGFTDKAVRDAIIRIEAADKTKPNIPKLQKITAKIVENFSTYIDDKKAIINHNLKQILSDSQPVRSAALRFLSGLNLDERGCADANFSNWLTGSNQATPEATRLRALELLAKGESPQDTLHTLLNEKYPIQHVMNTVLQENSFSKFFNTVLKKYFSEGVSAKIKDISKSGAQHLGGLAVPLLGALLAECGLVMIETATGFEFYPEEHEMVALAALAETGHLYGQKMAVRAAVTQAERAALARGAYPESAKLLSGEAARANVLKTVTRSASYVAFVRSFPAFELGAYAFEQACEKLGWHPNAFVEFVGHLGGGMIASQLFEKAVVLADKSLKMAGAVAGEAGAVARAANILGFLYLGVKTLNWMGKVNARDRAAQQVHWMKRDGQNAVNALNAKLKIDGSAFQYDYTSLHGILATFGVDGGIFNGTSETNSEPLVGHAILDMVGDFVRDYYNAKKQVREGKMDAEAFEALTQRLEIRLACAVHGSADGSIARLPNDNARMAAVTLTHILLPGLVPDSVKSYLDREESMMLRTLILGMDPDFQKLIEADAVAQLDPL